MIEVVSPGSFEKIEDGFKATYEETEISGMEGTTTILTIKENQVIITCTDSFKINNSKYKLFKVTNATIDCI